MVPTTSTQLAYFTAAPEDIRRIVLDYLTSKCYVDTAQAFARESYPLELDADGDEILPSDDEYLLDSYSLCQAQRRKEIKLKLLEGNINEAKDLLNSYFPMVLARGISTALYDPSHLVLNLCIQNFIEQARTIPLHYHQPQSSIYQSGISPTAKTCSLASTPDRKAILYNEMLSLHRLAHALSSQRDQTIYVQELNNVGGLLAYPVPEESKDLRRFLDLRRREAVAEQINDAILYRLGHTIPSLPDLIAQHTTVLFATLNRLGKLLPPIDQCPPGLVDILQKDKESRKPDESNGIAVNKGTGKDGKSENRGDDTSEAMIIPPFDVGVLLQDDSKSTRSPDIE